MRHEGEEVALRRRASSSGSPSVVSICGLDRRQAGLGEQLVERPALELPAAAPAPRGRRIRSRGAERRAARQRVADAGDHDRAVDVQRPRARARAGSTLRGTDDSAKAIVAACRTIGISDSFSPYSTKTRTPAALRRSRASAGGSSRAASDGPQPMRTLCPRRLLRARRRRSAASELGLDAAARGRPGSSAYGVGLTPKRCRLSRSTPRSCLERA